MPDYSKSIIYTIRSRNNIYVGSTVNFRSRKNDHKKCIYNEKNKNYNIKLYKTIRENNYEWVMRPYSKYPCNSKLELTIEEERIRQLLKADLNMCACSSGCSTKKEYMKQYCDQNKDKRKQYRDQHKDHSKKYREEHKDDSKKYREEHKDYSKEYMKQYREEHKDELNEQARQKVTCECGCVVAKGGIARHHKSKKHINLMEKLNQ